jgi:hypothetical protein
VVHKEGELFVLLHVPAVPEVGEPSYSGLLARALTCQEAEQVAPCVPAHKHHQKASHLHAHQAA